MKRAMKAAATDTTHLTHQQERFAQLVAIGSNQSEAYREAYPKSKKWKPEAVWSQASQLAANSKVSDRVADLRAQVVASAKITLEEHLRELERIKRQARMAGDLSVALKAEELRGKASGFYVQKTEAGKAVEVNQVDIEAIQKRIAERYARLGMPIPPQLLSLSSQGK